ncbi:hypothetical protein ACWF99_23490 [Nocardia sp. NPDC055002]
MPGGPGGQEVGRISIRVVPDTEKFRRELKAQLEAIEKEMQGEVAVNANLDSAGALARFAAMLAAMRAMSGNGVRVGVDVDGDGKLGLLSRSMERFRAVLAKTTLGRFNADLKEYARRTREGNRNLTENEVRLRALKEAFRRVSDAADRAGDRIQRMGGRLTRARDSIVETRNTFRDLARTADASTRWARNSVGDTNRFTVGLRSLAAQSRVTGAELRRMTGNGASAGLRRLGDAALRAGQGLYRMDVRTQTQAMRGLRRVIGGNADESIRLSTALSRLRNGLSNTGSVISKITPSFNSMGSGSHRARNRILLLSAAVASLVGPAAALIGGALGALPSLLFAGAAAAGAIALGMDGIKRAASQLKAPLDELKASVSNTFEQRLTPQFAQLIPLMQGPLKTGMNAVANGLADISQGFIDVVTSGTGMAQIESILTKTGTLFTNLKPYFSDLTSTFLTMGDVGAHHFQGLAASMTNWAANFKSTIQGLVADGSMDQMFGGLKSFADGFGNLFNDIVAIGVRAMGQLGGPMGNFLTTLGNVLTTIEPGLISFADSVLGALSAFGTGVAPEFNTFLTNMGSALTTVEPILTSLVNNGLKIFNAAMTTLGPAIQAATPGLTSFFDTIGNAVSGALPLLGPALQQMGQAFTDMMTNEAFMASLTNFITTFAQALAELLPKVLENAPAILELATSILNLATQALPFVVTAIEVAAGVLTALIGTVQGVIDIFNGLASGVQTALQAVVQAIQGNFSNAGSLLLEAGKQVVQGLINGITSMLGAAVAAARSVGSAVADAAKSVLGINSPSKVFTEFGEYVGEGLVNGIESQVGAATAAATNLANALAKSFEGSQGKVATQVADYKAAMGEMSDATTDATKTIKGQKVPVDKAFGEMDDETKQAKELMQLRAEELQFEIDRLDDMSETAATKARKKALQAQIDAIKKQQDEMEFEAKKLAYENKYGKPYDSILDEIEQQAPEAESKGLSIMERLQKGLKDGWGGVQRELKLMVDDFGEIFGSESLSSDFDEILEKSNPGTIADDFANATIKQGMSDLGISGDGLFTGGLSAAATYIFNVATADEAEAVKNRQQNKEALQYTRR